jgi:hypothetical protein
MMHVVKQIERRFPKMSGRIISALVALSVGGLVLGLVLLLAA